MVDAGKSRSIDTVLEQLAMCHTIPSLVTLSVLMNVWSKFMHDWEFLISESEDVEKLELDHLWLMEFPIVKKRNQMVVFVVFELSGNCI